MGKRGTERPRPWVQYAVDAANGNIVVGHWVRLAARRYLDDIASDKYELRDDVVERAIQFIALFKHFKGKHSGKPFTLQPWQQWVVSAIVGVYRKGTDIRKHSTVYLEIARKTGKSATCAALALYFLIADGMDGAEVGCLANSREQAKIVYEFCEVFSKQIDPKSKLLKCYRDRIKMAANNSKLIVCSSADDKLDGGNYTAAIVDEYHAARDTKLRDVIKSSMVRENSVLITITSAGFSTTGPCYKLRTAYTEILSGLKEDDSVFAAIYSLDEGDVWTDPSVWAKSTPNLGVTVSEEYIARQVQSALNNPSEEVGVRTKTLNEWLQVSEVWIPDRYVLDCTQKLRLEDFRDCETYVGVDLSAVSDMTAVSYLMRREDDERFWFYTDYYLPESCLAESPNKEWYKYLKRQGLLHITPGNVVSYDDVANDLMRNYDLLNIRKVAYDSWNATAFAISATEMGLPLEPYSQSIGNFNKPTKEFERLIRSGKAVLDSNETTTWMFRNVAIKRDLNGNEKPSKGYTPDRKIDGIIAMIQALGVYLDTPRYTGSIFVV